MKNKEAKSSPHQEGKFYFVKLDFSFGKTRRIMLKISLKQGQYVNIGDNIRVVYVGGTGNHGRLMIDAPKEVKIARSTVEQNPERRKDTYYPEPAISKEAQDEIKKILWNERMKAETKKRCRKNEPLSSLKTSHNHLVIDRAQPGTLCLL